MKTFHDAATTHYIRSSQMFHTNLLHSPALFLVSKTDPGKLGHFLTMLYEYNILFFIFLVGSVTSNQRVRENWESNGIEVNAESKNKDIF